MLNLGAGVQSTDLYMRSMRGEVRRFDVAIFADTGEEPQAVYRHLEKLKALNGIPILVASKGKLGDDLMRGRNSAGGSVASIPAFTMAEGASERGIVRRQCSEEYKIAVIERAIRRQVLGLRERHRIPKDVEIHQYFGISYDERSRASRIWERFHIQKTTQCVPHFPLVDAMITRANCIEHLQSIGIWPVPRSACVFCPFHSDAEWQSLKDANGADWARCVEIDQAMRTPGVIINRGLDAKLYLHKTCKPIDEIEFQPLSNPKELQLGFAMECDGVCGV